MQGQEMERLCSLFFELSNEDRLNIILKLMDEPKKLTHIANELDLTVQECSRQLARLHEIDLVTKNPDGFFVLQPYGRHAFRLFPGFQFLTEHVEYFNRHTLEVLPEKFMGRIGELRACKPVRELMGTIASIEKVMREAKESFYYMTNENLASAYAYKLALEALERGVQVKAIEPAGYSPPMEIVKNVSDEIQEAFAVHRSKGTLVDRTHEKIDVSLYMNEKEVAILAFPALTGEFDYLGFTSTDPKVLEWCNDLHSYYWERGGSRDEYYIDSKD
ncbi:MAG: helix-turn-helix transcriptional regulator [Candidatus Bathyarchaeota archaeon]